MSLGGLIHSDGLAEITQQVVMESWRISTFGPSDYLIYINLASKKIVIREFEHLFINRLTIRIYLLTVN